MKRLMLIASAVVLTMFGTVLNAAEPESTTSPETMQEMQAHMQAMQEQMKKINTTTDPQARQQMMHEHMQSMHKGMMMMGQMENGGNHQMGSGAMGQHKHEPQCKQDDAQCVRMQEMAAGQQHMQQRMQMMQMMMQQMMEHQAAQEESKKLGN